MELYVNQTLVCVPWEKGVILIGRDKSCDVVIGDLAAARMHLRMMRFADLWMLEDLGGMNGSFCNGVRMVPGELHEVRSGDVIGIAGDRTVLQFIEPPAVGDRLDGGKYIIEKVLSCGATRYYQGQMPLLNKPCVIKAALLGPNGTESRESAALAKEMELRRQLDHPMIPRIYSIVRERGYIFLTMELVEGESLQQLVEREGPLPWEQVRQWAVELCDVLGWMHTKVQPLVHRNLNPDNIMLGLDGSLKLVGLGSVCTTEEAKKDRCVLGPVGYAAPELLCDGFQPGAWTDIYALGMTMRYLLTGEEPNGPGHAVRPIRQVNPELPKRLEEIIDKCIRPDPAERFQSCQKLLNALNGEVVSRKRGLIARIFGK